MKDALYSRSVAANMVVANMIGTGIFTSIGFQVMPDAIPDPFAIMMIWLIGGIFSLCGALAYAEVATTLCESGGEYTFLSRLYHPVIGMASGWVSLIVGFS
ncbi:MAG: amino acid permease, partial [Bacteroidota bacterium]